MAKILLVEDDERLRKDYAQALTAHGFEVSPCATADEALEAAETGAPHLALLDISLNGDVEAGYGLCIQLRAQLPQLPVIFLTSLETETDMVSGFRVGADDYVKKTTLDWTHLIYRIRALLRRADVMSDRSKDDVSEIRVERGGLILDGEQCRAAWKGLSLELSMTQFWILQELAKSPGQVKTIDQLMRAAHTHVETNTIVAHIRNIRQSFRNIDPDFDQIRTERGRGYRWMESSVSPL